MVHVRGVRFTDNGVYWQHKTWVHTAKHSDGALYCTCVVPTGIGTYMI
jgi:hypothetical protein